MDKVEDLIVFDICGNRYRLITFISFSKQICYIKQILTHAIYDKGRWKK
jgi:mRNA interferase HigB